MKWRLPNGTTMLPGQPRTDKQNASSREGFLRVGGKMYSFAYNLQPHR